MPKISVIVRKAYGAVEVIKGVDLEIESGEFVVFVGPSGCGKSTLLRMLAGLEQISEGEIRIGERRVNDVVFAHPFTLPQLRPDVLRAYHGVLQVRSAFAFEAQRFVDGRLRQLEILQSARRLEQNLQDG